MAFVDPYDKKGSSKSGGFIDPAADKSSDEVSPGVLGYSEALLEAPLKFFLGAGAKAGSLATSAVGGEPMDQAVNDARRIEGKVTDWRLLDRTKGAEHKIGDIFEKGVGYLGDIAGDPAPFAIGDKERAVAESPAGRTLGEAGTELGMAGLGGMLAKGKGIRLGRGPKQAFVDPGPVMTMDEGGRGARDKAEIETPTVLEPDIAEDGTVTQPKVKTDKFGKPTFEEFEEPAKRVGMRDAAPLTEQEYYGPREKGEPADNGIAFKQYDPNRIADQVAAADKPGFMRSAEEVMRARELERTEKPKETGAGPEANKLGSQVTDFWNDRLANKLGAHPELDQNHVRGGLEVIKNTSESPYYKELATKLLEDKDFKPDFKLIGEYDKPGTVGRYITKSHAVTLKEGLHGSEQVFLHEAIHARTYGALEAFKQKGELPEHMQHLVAPVRRISQLYDSLGLKTASGAAKELASKYGMQSVHEFVAEGFANPDFQRLLAQMPLSKELRQGTLKTYWDSFVRNIGKLLGLDRKGDTYLSELLRSGSDLMSGMGKDERTYFADSLKPGKDLGMELEPMVKKEIKDKGVMGATIEAVREHKLDRRPIEELIEKDLSGKDLADFSPKNGGLVQRAYNRLGKLVKENLLQDTTIALMMKNNKGTGPLIKWTTDQISRIDRDHMIKTKAALDEALGPFRKMFWDKAERKNLNEMWNKWSENIGKKDLSPSDFTTDRQWKVYQGFQKIHDRILGDINAKRAGAGYKPIERIPSYFHSVWDGDYRVFGYDAAGEKKWAMGAKTEAGSLKMMKKLEEAHPDLRWEQSEVVKDKYGLIDLSAFEDALRVMSKDDPVTKAIQTTYQEILQHRGFGRTGLHKKGVLGFMGMEGGVKGLMNMERAFDQYVNQAYRYLGNLEKQKVLEDLAKIPLEQRKQMPQTMDFLYSYVHKTRGAREEVWYDKLAGEITSMVGLGSSLPRTIIHGFSQVATVYWLTTPRFLVSQTVQSMNAIPRLLSEHGVKEGAGAFFEGWKNTIQPDALAKEATQWASDRAYLDPTIKNLIHKDLNEVPTGNVLELGKEVMSWPAAWIEHNLVRAPVFLMFEHALRDSIKDKSARFEEAAQKADYYMVNYGRVHAPMLYDKMGLIGDAARPLKQYSHNYIGQFMEYVADAKNKNDYAPLASFFAVQMSTAGIKGMLFIAEATLAVNLINAMFDTNVPTPEQLLLKGGFHDALIYGGLSYVLNTDVSSSVAAPGLPSMLNFPPIEFTVGMVKDVGTFALHYLHGEETDQDRLRAWLAITPTAAHEYLKNLYTPEGQPTANPNDPQLRGNYRRTDAERIWSSLIGAKPLDEAKADAIVRNVRKELIRDLQRKLDSVDAITDRIQNGRNVDPKLIDDYVKNGGDPSRLTQSIVDRVKQRQQTGVERFQDKQISPTQAHKLDVLKDYLDKAVPPTSAERPLGFSPETGMVQPISMETGVGGKRIMNDTDGNPTGGFRPLPPGDDYQVRPHPDDKMNRAPTPGTKDQNFYDPSRKPPKTIRT